MGRDSTGQPFELPALSEQGARKWLRDKLRQRHLNSIIAQSNLQTAVSSSIVHEQGHALYMIPIYIGAFRFRDRPWRFLINAQSEKLSGKSPSIDSRSSQLLRSDCFCSRHSRPCPTSRNRLIPMRKPGSSVSFGAAREKEYRDYEATTRPPPSNILA